MLKFKFVQKYIYLTIQNLYTVCLLFNSTQVENINNKFTLSSSTLQYKREINRYTMYYDKHNKGDTNK